MDPDLVSAMTGPIHIKYGFFANFIIKFSVASVTFIQADHHRSFCCSSIPCLMLPTGTELQNLYQERKSWISASTKVMCSFTCSDSSSLMFVRPNMVALTVERIFSWVLMVGMRSHTFGKRKKGQLYFKAEFSACVCPHVFVLTCSRLVLIRLSVHCLATSLASLVTSSEALAMSLAHWISARLFPLPPRTSRDISAMSRAIRLAAAMMSLPCERGWGNKSCEQDTEKEHSFG